MRIGYKISWLVVGTAVLSTGLLTWVGYSSARRQYVAGVDRQLAAAAAALPGVIGDDYLGRALVNENVSREEYDRLVHSLSDLADRSGVFYLYVFVRAGEEVVHVATSAAAAERAAGDWPGLHAPYEEPPTELMATLADGETRFAEYTDEFGAFRSIFVRHTHPGDRHQAYVVGVDVTLSEIHSDLVGLILRYLVAGGVVAVLTGLLGLLLARQIARPVQRLAEGLREAAEERGDLTHEMDENRRDELGTLAHWFNAFFAQLREIRRTVASSTLNVGSASAEIAASARQQEQTVRAFQESTGQAAVAVAEIASTGRSLVEIVRGIDERARHTSRMATAGRGQLAELDALLAGMAEATAITSARIEAIKANADKIGLATTMMINVADRTNLLSVNAAIEAGKAGDHGRGFRVVAREIRHLAEQTAEATLEIESIVAGIRESVAHGVTDVNCFREQMEIGLDAVRQLTGEMGAIIGDVESLGASFGEVNEMTAEQSTGAEHIRDSIGQLSTGACEIAESSAAFAQVTSQLHETAEELKAHVSSMTIGGDSAGR